MRLSKLTVYGFKSFADKIEIEFGDGMTSVVGPNGCGKTNVVDAIKWVMGEQKPTAIRARSMEDVIFNGSAERKPLGFAEVTLTIDDAHQELPVDQPEISITRRLFRSGESEYLLNKQACRLRDIQDLFMDTGLAGDSYSVIQQGMVDVIISDKRDDRRAIFEEATGIQKYKSRRRETELKLKNTQQDLLRIGDVIGEVEKAVRSLKRQVNRAKRFQKYRDRLHDAEIHLAILKDRKFEEEMKPLREEMRQMRESREGTGSDLARIESKVEEARARELELEQAVGSLQRQVDEARERVREVEGELIALRERRTAASESAERSREEAVEMDRRRTAAIEEHERLETQLGTARSERDRLEEQEKGLTDRLEEIEGRLKTARERLADLKDRHDRASNYYQDEAQRAEFLQFKVQERQSRLEGLKRQAEEAREGAGKAREDRRRLEAELEQAREERGRLRERREAAEQAREGAAEALQAATRGRAEAEGTVKAARAERDVVSDLIQRLEGVDEAARDLRQDPEGFGPLLGEVLDVDSGAVAAVESALGPALEGLLTADDDALMQAIERLDGREEGGQAVLLAPYLAREDDGSVPEWAGAEGAREVLSDAVGGSGPEARLARGLLSRTLLVEDMDIALQLAPRASRTGWTLVTDRGEVVHPGGIVRAGRPAQRRAGGILSRRLRLEELEGWVRSAAEREAEAEQTLEERRADLEQRRGELTAATRALEEAEEHLAETERKSSATVSRLSGLQERAEDLETRIEDEENELAADRTELEKLSPLLSQALEESGVLGGEMESQRRQVQAIDEEREQARQEQQELRVNRVRSEHRIEGLQREMDRLVENAEQLQEAAAARRQQAEESEERHQELDGTISERENVLKQRREVRSRLETDLAEREKTYMEHRNVVADLEEDLKKERRAREDQQERLHSTELRLSELSMRRENLAERIRDEYDVDLEEVDEASLAEEGEEPPSHEELEEEVRTLRERLDRLGPVNLLALEEYESEKERLDFLTEQKQDLEDARDTLQQTIRKINKTARERFLATFEAIRANFRRTYEQFFEGGEADIYLAGEGDPLEDRIEIVARPKGKILKSMAALSGGEKALTAVSLLFAIYLVKPSPFCVLDEVDAPLDEANIGRFLKVLKSFEDSTQFILITHNKRTMEASDTFLGITMEEPGVSKVVGVRFGEEAAA